MIIILLLPARSGYGSNSNAKDYNVEFDRCPLGHWKDPQDRSKDIMRAASGAVALLDSTCSRWN